MSEMSYEAWLNLTNDEKWDYIGKNKHLEDCSFAVGKEDEGVKSFGSHKFILSGASEVFDKMLNGSFEEANSSDGIRLSDVEADIFEMFLEFVYFKTITNMKVYSTETLMSLLYVARKYMISELEEAINEECENRCSNPHNYTADDFIKLFKSYMNEEFALRIIAKINQTIGLLESSSEVYYLEPEIFYKLMASIQENFSELNRFHMIENYIEMHSSVGKEQNNSITDDKFTRSNLDGTTMRKLRNLINYSRMSAEEFCIGPVNSNSLSTNKKLEILSHMCLNG